jgi:hypothetical protein
MGCCCSWLIAGSDGGGDSNAAAAAASAAETELAESNRKLLAVSRGMSAPTIEVLDRTRVGGRLSSAAVLLFVVVVVVFVRPCKLLL